MFKSVPDPWTKTKDQEPSFASPEVVPSPQGFNIGIAPKSVIFRSSSGHLRLHRLSTPTE